jgi:hypothetical protein
MKSRSTSMIVAALAAMISASPAQAGGLKQVAEISIPGDPITEGLSRTEEFAGKAGAGTLGSIETPHALLLLCLKFFFMISRFPSSSL